MKKWKKATLLDVETVRSIKLGWKVRRQVQQKLLEQKLLKCFLEPNERDTCIARYPKVMQPMIQDFMRNAQKQMRLNKK